MEKYQATSPIDTLQSTMEAIEEKVESTLRPTRKNILKRFPVFFSLFVTFGVSAVFFGFERLLEDVAFLNEHPVLILALGVLVLIITGTVYKKL